MDDSISRQGAIDAVKKCSVKEVTPAYMLIDKAEVMTELMTLAPAQPEDRCSECDAWNQYKNYTRQPEIIHCRECKHLEYDSIFDGYFCRNRRVKLDHFCGYAERRTDV